MRAMRLGLMVFAVVVGMALVMVAHAQDAEAPCTPGVLASPTINVSSGSSRQSSKAFTVKIKGSFEQKLQDGNFIRGEMHVIGARDSSGRTRTEFMMQCQRGDDGKPSPVKQITVFDPKARTNIHWQEGSIFGLAAEKNATLMRMNPPPAMPAPKLLTPEELAVRRKAAEARRPQQSEFKNEDLGTRNIAGAEAHGTRITRTIPPGEEGNELQLIVVDEQWQSKDLGLLMMTIHDDPRHGRTVSEVEEVNTNEPSATLFAPPEGYKIVEMKPQVEVPVNPATVAQ